MPSLYIAVLLSTQHEPHHMPTCVKGYFLCIIQPFFSAFRDKVDFTANTRLFRRQMAAFVEYIFQQTSYLASQTLGPV